MWKSAQSFACSEPRSSGAVPAGLVAHLFYFYVGTNDSRFRAENEQTYAELLAAHVPHLLFRVYQGGHNWSLWQQHAVGWVRAALGVASKPR